jgi:thiol-disulfide isomerase/thioredoxin
MLKHYLLIGALVGLLVLLSIPRTRLLGFEGFQGGSGSGSELLIVKASWCGHCKTAMPEFNRLVAAKSVKLRDGSDVTIRMLDDASDKSEIQALSVRGYPTILYRGPSGDRMEYSGPRTFDGVMGFLKGM